MQQRLFVQILHGDTYLPLKNDFFRKRVIFFWVPHLTFGKLSLPSFLRHSNTSRNSTVIRHRGDIFVVSMRYCDDTVLRAAACPALPILNFLQR